MRYRRRTVSITAPQSTGGRATSSDTSSSGMGLSGVEPLTSRLSDPSLFPTLFVMPHATTTSDAREDAYCGCMAAGI